MKPSVVMASAAILAFSAIAVNASPNEREHKDDDHRYEQQDHREARNRSESTERDYDRSKDGERYERHREDGADDDDRGGKRRDHDRD